MLNGIMKDKAESNEKLAARSHMVVHNIFDGVFVSSKSEKI